MRMHLVLIAGLALATPALAQDGVTIDTAATTSCLGAAVDASGKYACIGKASDACMNAPGGDSTAGMSGCLDAERAWWDARLNKTYGDLADLLHKSGGGQATALKTAEKAWIGYRDAECAYQAGTFDGGTGAGPATLACQMNLTGLRAIDLQASLDQMRDR